MPDYTYLIAAEGGDGILHAFSCPEGWKANHGDYVGYKGELFLVKKRIHIDTASDTFALLEELADILPAHALFSCVWKDGASNG